MPTIAFQFHFYFAPLFAPRLEPTLAFLLESVDFCPPGLQEITPLTPHRRHTQICFLKILLCRLFHLVDMLVERYIRHFIAGFFIGKRSEDIFFLSPRSKTYHFLVISFWQKLFHKNLSIHYALTLMGICYVFDGQVSYNVSCFYTWFGLIFLQHIYRHKWPMA